MSDANFAWSRRLLDALVGGGVQEAVISSGARCAPLVLAATRTRGLHLQAFSDERAAGFRALGIAKFTRRPVVLICTSGTAGANYHPAVIEARMAHVPLVVLTADRPPELRGTGAPQTIDQVELYGRHVLRSWDLDPPSALGDGTHWVEIAVEAVELCLRDPAGPVHLNVPFHEPLLPAPERIGELHQFVREPRNARLVKHAVSEAGCDWEASAKSIRDATRGIIVCGANDGQDGFLPALEKLARLTGFPVFADPISRVRFSAPAGLSVISHYDLALLNRECAEHLRPDLFIRFGGLPTSKRLNEWIAAAPAVDCICIDSHSEIADPYGVATHRIVSGLADACIGLAGKLEGHKASTDFAGAWVLADQRIREILGSAAGGREHLFEGDIAARVMHQTPARSVVFLSSSLPIRLVDSYAGARPGPLRVMANRGANGIDGVVSTAVGVASVSPHPVVLLVGDIAFLHDLNALATVSRERLNLKIVLINNDGGGIFSFLPLIEHSDWFESLVTMPHGLVFSKGAEMFGITHVSVNTMREFDRQFSQLMSVSGPVIIEVATSRLRTLEFSRAIQRRISDAGLLA